VCSLQGGHCEKRCEIKGGSQGMAVMAGKITKNLTMINSVEFGATFSLRFHIFFKMAFLEATHFFGTVFELDMQL